MKYEDRVWKTVTYPYEDGKKYQCFLVITVKKSSGCTDIPAGVYLYATTECHCDIDMKGIYWLPELREGEYGDEGPYEQRDLIERSACRIVRKKAFEPRGINIREVI